MRSRRGRPGRQSSVSLPFGEVELHVGEGRPADRDALSARASNSRVLQPGAGPSKSEVSPTVSPCLGIGHGRKNEVANALRPPTSRSRLRVPRTGRSSPSLHRGCRPGGCRSPRPGRVRRDIPRRPAGPGCRRGVGGGGAFGVSRFRRGPRPSSIPKRETRRARRPKGDA
jgi:hypothetical protein